MHDYVQIALDANGFAYSWSALADHSQRGSWAPAASENGRLQMKLFATVSIIAMSAFFAPMASAQLATFQSFDAEDVEQDDTEEDDAEEDDAKAEKRSKRVLKAEKRKERKKEERRQKREQSESDD